MLRLHRGLIALLALGFATSAWAISGGGITGVGISTVSSGIGPLVLCDFTDGTQAGPTTGSSFNYRSPCRANQDGDGTGGTQVRFSVEGIAGGNNCEINRMVFQYGSVDVGDDDCSTNDECGWYDAAPIDITAPVCADDESVQCATNGDCGTTCTQEATAWTANAGETIWSNWITLPRTYDGTEDIWIHHVLGTRGCRQENDSVVRWWVGNGTDWSQVLDPDTDLGYTTDTIVIRKVEIKS